jgi:7-alpha-hydroxysteroid dehydrogenase
MMILDLFRLDDKVAIVTGGGRGIGAASALALAECGADVVIASRTQSDLDHVAEQVAHTGRRAVSVAGDLADLDFVRSLVSLAQEEFGRLDVVVNNVGGAIPLPFFDTTPEYLEEAFHFNVTTAHALNLAAVPLILEQGGGSIVNISSVMGRVSGRGYAAYGTAKAGATNSRQRDRCGFDRHVGDRNRDHHAGAQVNDGGHDAVAPHCRSGRDRRGGRVSRVTGGRLPHRQSPRSRWRR